MKALRIIFCCALAFVVSACERKYQLSADRVHAEHVVLMVWDGMRPDFVTEENAPTLRRLAQQGVTFANNHSRGVEYARLGERS